MFFGQTRNACLPATLKPTQLKKHIVIALQAMFLACNNRRQACRQELLLETAVERELEGQPTQGGELVAPAAHQLPEEMFILL